MSLRMSVVGSDKERAFLRAHELLRKGSALTSSDCAELDRLFDAVDGAQLMSLTQNPEHISAMRRYDRHAQRLARPIVLALLALFLLSVVVGSYIAL